jgi:hypothetical protein
MELAAMVLERRRFIATSQRLEFVHIPQAEQCPCIKLEIQQHQCY